MSEKVSKVNFSYSAGLNTVIYPAEEVTDGMWQELQLIHNQSLKARMPANEWERADIITKQNDLKAYSSSRRNPNTLIGNGWSKGQLFSKALVAITYDFTTPISGVLTANNTSSSDRYSNKIQFIESWVKMLSPPSIPIPKIGNRRYVHLREAYVHPDYRGGLDVGDNLNTVSTIALAGVYHSLNLRHEKQKVVAYVIPNDLADEELSQITRLIGMKSTSEEINNLNGYNKEAKLVRVQQQVSEVMHNIIMIPDVKEIISRIKVLS